jgi:hypothetical protein
MNPKKGERRINPMNATRKSKLRLAILPTPFDKEAAAFDRKGPLSDFKVWTPLDPCGYVSELIFPPQ